MALLDTELKHRLSTAADGAVHTRTLFPVAMGEVLSFTVIWLFCSITDDRFNKRSTINRCSFNIHKHMQTRCAQRAQTPLRLLQCLGEHGCIVGEARWGRLSSDMSYKARSA